MKLTPEQAAQAVDYLGGPCRIEQAARMLGVPYNAFAEDFKTGRSEAERGEDTEAARFYLDAQQARARYIATIRTEAQAVAGSRESSDLMALALTIENDEGPLSADEDDVRQRSPLLSWTDRLEDPELTGDARKELAAVGEKAQRSMHELFSAMVADDARRREGASA